MNLTEILPLAVDFVLAGLLVAAIVYAVVISRRLKAFAAQRTGLEETVRDLNGAMVRASTGVDVLKATAGQQGQQLQQLVERGRALTEDLAFLIERGEALADRLEQARRPAATPEPRSAPAVSAPEPDVDPEILKSLEHLR